MDRSKFKRAAKYMILGARALNIHDDVILNLLRGRDVLDYLSDRMSTGKGPKMPVAVYLADNARVEEWPTPHVGLYDGDRVDVHKIDTMKAVRTITGWGLKEAKDWVERSCAPIVVNDPIMLVSLQKMFGSSMRHASVTNAPIEVDDD